MADLAKKQWKKPEVKTLAAGAAEGGSTGSSDFVSPGARS